MTPESIAHAFVKENHGRMVTHAAFEADIANLIQRAITIGRMDGERQGLKSGLKLGRNSRHHLYTKAELAKIFGINKSTLNTRLRRGDTLYQALTTPLSRR